MLVLARRRRLCAAALALALANVAASCGGGPHIQLCGEIPEGGCPLGRGGTCDDATCNGLFDCVEGKWKEVTVCEQGQGGSSSSASVSSTGAGCQPVLLNHSNEKDGCTPDLEVPDCPAAAAEGCEPCLTGCVDFFMCKASGWTNVAFCDDAGNLVLTTR